MSRHSCYTDGHANGAVVDTLGDGDFGAPKRVPSLLGVRHRSSFLHDGRARSLRDAFARYGHPPLEQLDEAQIDDLVACLSSLQATHVAEDALRFLGKAGPGRFTAG